MSGRQQFCNVIRKLIFASHPVCLSMSVSSRHLYMSPIASLSKLLQPVVDGKSDKELQQCGYTHHSVMPDDVTQNTKH